MRRSVSLIGLLIAALLIFSACGKETKITSLESPETGSDANSSAERNSLAEGNTSGKNEGNLSEKNESNPLGKNSEKAKSNTSDKNDKVETNSDISEQMDNIGVVIDTTVDVFAEADIKSERVTQAIFNQPVEILEETEDWLKVKVVDGYTGWVKSKFVSTDTLSIDKNKYKYKVVISAKTKTIYSQVKGGITVKEVVMGTELYANNKIDGSYEVALPGRITGWVSEEGTIELEPEVQIPETQAEDFIDTAKKFKGVKYMWGGVSANGLDCSGLTYICARINGINLPRDSKDQFKVGKRVEKSEIQPGDLVFFSTNEDLKDISHVGIYLGDNEFIHAAKGKGYVLISSIESSYYQKRLVGARRLFY